MKKILKTFLLIGLAFVLFFGLVFAQNAKFAYEQITWNSGAANSDTLITTGADTTDWFPIEFGKAEQARYPETLSFLMWGDMGAAADSVKGTFSLDLSNDKVIIYNYGTLAALPVGTDDPKDVTKILTDMPLFKFGRVIITANLESGDSSMFGVQLTKDSSNY